MLISQLIALCIRAAPCEASIGVVTSSSSSIGTGSSPQLTFGYFVSAKLSERPKPVGIKSKLQMLN